MKETIEEQFKRLNDESILPMAIDDGSEIVISCVGFNRKRKRGRGIFDYIVVTYRNAKGEEKDIRYSHRRNPSRDDNANDEDDYRK